MAGINHTTYLLFEKKMCIWVSQTIPGETQALKGYLRTIGSCTPVLHICFQLRTAVARLPPAQLQQG